jgi:hypothetical protein
MESHVARRSGGSQWPRRVWPPPPCWAAAPHLLAIAMSRPRCPLTSVQSDSRTPSQVIDHPTYFEWRSELLNGQLHTAQPSVEPFDPGGSGDEQLPNSRERRWGSAGDRRKGRA